MYTKVRYSTSNIVTLLQRIKHESHLKIQAERRTKITKSGSGGGRVLDLLNITDVPYCFWVRANYREKWKHDWHHNPDNKRGANDSEKEKYKRYNTLKRADLKTSTDIELEEYDHYKEKPGRWTTTQRLAFKDAISKEGVEMYRRMLHAQDLEGLPQE